MVASTMDDVGSRPKVVSTDFFSSFFCVVVAYTNRDLAAAERNVRDKISKYI
jgi:hypothetical protein